MIRWTQEKTKVIFFGRHDKCLDAWRITVPAEWARVFRAGGGVVAFVPVEGRLLLTTQSEAGSAADAKELNHVSCKMDVRGRITLPLVLLPILGAVRQRNLIADVDLEVLAFLEKKEHQNVIDID